MSILKNEKVINELMYPIVKQVKTKLKNGNTLFISKFNNADRVLNGMDLLSRAVIEEFNKDSVAVSLSVKELSLIKKETDGYTKPVFYSTTGVKGIGVGYLVEVEDKLVLVGANSEYLEK